MPVVTLTAPALPTVEDEQRALVRLASAVADALGLRPADVAVSSVHTATAVLGTDVVDAWPLVALHGGRRPAARMADALGAARRCVAQDWACSPDEVWVQWLVADDLAAGTPGPASS